MQIGAAASYPGLPLGSPRDLWMGLELGDFLVYRFHAVGNHSFDIPATAFTGFALWVVWGFAMKARSILDSGAGDRLLWA